MAGGYRKGQTDVVVIATARTGSNERPLRVNPVSFAMYYSLSLFARRGTSVSCQSALVNTTDRWDTRFGGLDGHNKSAQTHPPGVLTSQRSSQGARIMTATSITRIVVPSLVLVAACGAALAFGIMHAWREPPVETRAATAAPEVSPPTSGAPDKGSAALATVQAEANAAAAALAVAPHAPDTNESVPAFDIARIERTGDAVIAGTATPGATVELLRNGELHDRTVADKSGQFVMVPPRLPAGDYELTLRSQQPDGKQAISKQSVAVALAEPESSTGALQPRAEVPFNVPETVGKNRSAPDQPLDLLKHGSPPSLRHKWRSGRTSPFHSRRAWLPPPLCQTEAHRPPCPCPGRPPSYPLATASGASAATPTARACDMQSFTKRTGTKFETQIGFIPARSLSFR
jgi:hypothetical protein